MEAELRTVLAEVEKVLSYIRIDGEAKEGLGKWEAVGSNLDDAADALKRAIDEAQAIAGRK